MVTWQPMASVETRAPSRSSRSIRAGIAVISLDFSNTASWPSTNRLLVAKADGVENRLHWRLDVVMNEDQDRSRLGNGPHNLAVLRHMALNVMQKDSEKGSLRGKIKRAGWDEAYLAWLLTLF